MNKVLLGFLFLTLSLSIVNAKESTDCLVIEDENSIICKYISSRNAENRHISVEWLNPDKKISRVRNILVPAGHGSVYDFRYIDGRMKGTWTFNVSDKDKKYTTTFEIR